MAIVFLFIYLFECWLWRDLFAQGAVLFLLMVRAVVKPSVVAVISVGIMVDYDGEGSGICDV